MLCLGMCAVASGLGLLVMNSVVGASGLDSKALRVSYQKGDQTWSKYVCCKKISVVHFCVCVYVIYAAEMIPMEWRIIGTGEIGLRVAEISKVLHSWSWVVWSVASSWLQRLGCQIFLQLVLMSFQLIEFPCWRWDLGWFPAYCWLGFTVWFPSSWLLRGNGIWYIVEISQSCYMCICIYIYIHGWRFSRPHFTWLKQLQTFGD